jgi:hypothetical protein
MPPPPPEDPPPPKELNRLEMSWGKAPSPPEKILERELPIPGLGGACGKGEGGEGEVDAELADDPVPLPVAVPEEAEMEVSVPLAGSLLELLAVPVFGSLERSVAVPSDEPALSCFPELSVSRSCRLQLEIKEENTKENGMMKQNRAQRLMIFPLNTFMYYRQNR